MNGQPLIVVATGVLCVLFWIVAYVGIIHRGLRDRTYGMPFAALAANLSWELVYGFLLDPMGDQIHVLSVPCFLIDLVIAWQCLAYGPRDYTDPLLSRYFRVVFCAAAALAFPIVYLAFYELHDPLGEYTGFGINLMMSLLFLAMLVRRTDCRGQSLYIAIAKWLGTLSAYLATLFTVTTSTAHPLPGGVGPLIAGVAHHDYPLTPLISVLYLGVFCADLLYIALLRARLAARGIRPWRHW